MVTKKSNAGQPKAIESPEALKAYFLQYKAWVKENPYRVHDFVGKDATEVWRDKQRPLTWSGFQGWLAMMDIATDLVHYERNTNDGYSEYLPIIRVIKAETRMDIIDGASSGVFNANIAARLESLVERIEVDDNRKAVGDLFPLDDSQKTD